MQQMLFCVAMVRRVSPNWVRDSFSINLMALLGGDVGSDMVNEKLCCAGNISVLGCSDGDIPILGNIKGLVYHIVAWVIREQRVGDGDAQAAFHHRKKRMVAADLIMQIRLVGNSIQKTGNFKVVFLVKLDKGRAL